MLSTTAAAHPNKHPLSKGGLTLYEACWKALGADCGRNVSEDGFRHADGSVTDATKNQLHAWRDRIRAALAPPPAPEPVVSTSTYAAPAPAPAPTYTSGGCPSYMAAEASSPTATNPTSGAYGCFQVLPSTAAAYGCDLSTMDGQYACKDAICAGQGNGAWAASGATPCG